MTDPRIEALFAEGSAPERDVAFADRVHAGIDRARLQMRLALAGGVVLALALAGTIYVTGRAVAGWIEPIAERVPEFMGVPLPVLLAVLVVGLLLRACCRIHLRPL